MAFAAAALVGRASLELTFLDHRHRPDGVRSLAARRGGHTSVRVRRTEPAPHVWRIDLQGTAGELTVDYAIDPTFPPPRLGGSPTDARSRVTSALGVLRSRSLFPVTDLPLAAQGAHQVTFVLPPGWTVVAPWPRTDDGSFVVPADDGSSVEYIAIGPFEVVALPAGPGMIRLAALRSAEGLAPERVASLLRQAEAIAGTPPPVSGREMSVVLVPDTFMHGGAAGRRSVVQPPSPVVLAHEFFHWWNDNSLTAPDAEWFHEGFTQYYGIRIAERAGAMAPAAAAECWADLNAELRYLEHERPHSLAEVSRQSHGMKAAPDLQDAYASRLVYSKGALFALLLDRTLREAGRQLDEAVRAVLSSDRRPLDNDGLRAVFAATYGGAVVPLFDAYVLGGEALPDLAVGPPTGRSGCARFLPEAMRDRLPPAEFPGVSGEGTAAAWARPE